MQAPASLRPRNDPNIFSKGTLVKTYTISRLAHRFRLSRSTLLYYDRLGLLRSSGRTPAGYRTYTEADAGRLERICAFRQAGLALKDIQAILSSHRQPPVALLERRLREIGGEILELRTKQNLLAGMLRSLASDRNFPRVDKAMWTGMLRAAGMDDRAMGRWHAEFEHRAPDAHREFLLSLGLGEKEVQQIREWSRKNRSQKQE